MPRQRRDTPRDALIRYFGRELRAAREAAGLSQPQLAAELGYTHQWIGKVERGESAPSDNFVTDLETFFQAGGRFQRLRDEIKGAHRHQVLLPGFPEYLELEQRAVRMRCYATQLVPGLLQAEGSMRALISTGPTPEAAEEMVTSRLERQTALTREKPLSAWFVLDEAVLRRPIGTPEEWRAQLEWLLKAAELPNVRIWVLPFSSVTYAALDGSFLILTLNDGSEALYTEGPGLSQLIDDPDRIAECALRFDLIMGEALTSGESLKMIRRALEDFS
jgi:transcriptional regulator with XRE-family HTH domain